MKRMGKCTMFILMAGLAFTPLWPQKSPDEFFKGKVGEDRFLIPYPQIIEYFRYLAQNSPRIKVSDEGKTTLGNPMILALISSEENIRDLSRLTDINRKLADSDRLAPDEAKTLIGNARIFVLITASIHASEIAASQMAMILAHQLATRDDPQTKTILEQTVVLLMPSINPDGQIMVCDWYRKYAGTPYEGGNMVQLYHYYAGHDDNRDYFMLNLKESQVLNTILHHRYFPQVYLDMHQMGSNGPRIFVPPFKDPFNQNLSPVMLREVELIGASMALKLQESGKKGVANSYGFDAYWPGGTKNTAWYKNVVGLLTELASCRVATPIFIDASELRGGGKGLPEYKPQVNFPDPWPGGLWRLDDIVDYELIACQALLETSAKNRNEFITNFYQMGQDNVQHGQNEAPYAYVIFKDQWDTPEANLFMKKMQEHGVRLYRLKDNCRVGQRLYEKGTYVIPLSQPYRAFIKVMMERQRYPQIHFNTGGPIMEPYDTTGWTLPLLMNVKYEALEEPLTNVPFEVADGIEFPESSPYGTGNHYLLPGRYNKTFLAVNRLIKAGAKVYRVHKSDHTKVGDFLVPVTGVSEGKLKEIFSDTFISPERVNLSEKEEIGVIVKPRIAIYQSFFPSTDEGWTRWILDAYEFPYKVLHNVDFTDKAFQQKYNAIIFASQNRNVIVEGKYSSDRYDFPAPFLPKEYQGGIGKKGIEALKEMVKNGGRLILLDSSWELAQKDFELPVTNILANTPSTKFLCPGSILQVRLENSDPLAWGMEPVSCLFFSNSAAFRAASPEDQGIKRFIVGRFAGEGPHLLSGYMEGGDLLNNTVTAVRYQVGKGQVVIFGGRIQFRAWTTGTFKLLFNALFLQ